MSASTPTPMTPQERFMRARQERQAQQAERAQASAEQQAREAALNGMRTVLRAEYTARTQAIALARRLIAQRDLDPRTEQGRRDIKLARRQLRPMQRRAGELADLLTFMNGYVPSRWRRDVSLRRARRLEALWCRYAGRYARGADIAPPEKLVAWINENPVHMPVCGYCGRRGSNWHGDTRYAGDPRFGHWHHCRGEAHQGVDVLRWAERLADLERRLEGAERVIDAARRVAGETKPGHHFGEGEDRGYYVGRAPSAEGHADLVAALAAYEAAPSADAERVVPAQGGGRS